MTTTTTEAEHLAAAAQHYQDATDSYERSDTDGFLSQWASGIMGDLEHQKALIAADGGTAEFSAIFLLDGTVASTHRAHGQYGPFWVLNDHAAEVLGRRFLSSSEAEKIERRRANNRKKGITEGTIKVAAYADTVGSGYGLAGAASVYVTVRPVVADLIAGDYEVIEVEA